MSSCWSQDRGTCIFAGVFILSGLVLTISDSCNAFSFISSIGLKYLLGVNCMVRLKDPRVGVGHLYILVAL